MISGGVQYDGSRSIDGVRMKLLPDLYIYKNHLKQSSMSSYIYHVLTTPQ